MKKDIIDNYAAGAAMRMEVLDNALSGISAEFGRGHDLDVHIALADISAWDREVDQMEIANLIAVANSDAFSDTTREVAIYRVKKMLELDA